MAQVISQGLMLIGASFMLIAAIGVARMPDLFMRMHSSTKSATLGVGFLMLGVIVHFADVVVMAQAVVVVAFMFATAPIGAHVLGRAAYFSGVPLWKGTLSDELREHYDARTHELESFEIAEGAAHADAQRPQP